MMAIVTRESPALAGAGFGAEYSMHMRVEAAEGADEGGGGVGGEVGRGGGGGSGGGAGGHSSVVRRTAAGKSQDIDGRYQRVGGDDDDDDDDDDDEGSRRGGAGNDDDGESDMEALEIATAPGGGVMGASSYSCRGLVRSWCGGLSKRLFPPVLGNPIFVNYLIAYVLDTSYYTPFMHTFIAVCIPMYTRCACIYTIYTPYIHLTHL